MRKYRISQATAQHVFYSIQCHHGKAPDRLPGAGCRTSNSMSKELYGIADSSLVEDLRQRRRGAGRYFAGDPTRHVRLAGPQRRRQVDPDAHPGHLAGMRFRLGLLRRLRRARRQGRDTPHARLSAAGLRPVSESDGLRTARPLCQSERPVAARAPARSGRRPAAANQSVRCAPPAPGHVFGRHAPALRHRPGAAGRPEADHRRRTDGRPRSAGTGALPQPAVGHRRRQDRDPVDPYRVRRGRPVRQHGHHQQGPCAVVRQDAGTDR